MPFILFKSGFITYNVGTVETSLIRTPVIRMTTNRNNPEGIKNINILLHESVKVNPIK